jgi:hypothetical protein
MGSYNDIETEVKSRLGERTDIDARLVTWINDAYFELMLSPRFRFYELEKQATMQTINTLAAYDLPTDLWFILDIRDFDNGTKLRLGHWSQFDKTSVTYGRPVRYAHFADTVELDPVPDDVYDMILRYKYRPPELSEGSSTVLPREWDELIVALATQKGWEALENTDKAVVAAQLVERLVRTHLDAEYLEDMDSETTIGVRME